VNKIKQAMNKFQIVSKSANETIKIAKTIAPYFQLGDVIVLDGDLGTGKTQFVKGFAAELGATDPVTSPTFTVAQFYNAKIGSILHIDTYRLSGVNEFKDTALSDFFPQSIVLIEWGAKIIDDLEDYIFIKFENVAANKDHRTISFSCAGNMSAKFQKLFELLFLDRK
jgi:tRNA threonylcarbamoyladenosine biosynthesis protein TsaE